LLLDHGRTVCGDQPQPPGIAYGPVKPIAILLSGFSGLGKRLKRRSRIGQIFQENKSVLFLVGLIFDGNTIRKGLASSSEPWQNPANSQARAKKETPRDGNEKKRQQEGKHLVGQGSIGV
jgi:hypothetical protein